MPAAEEPAIQAEIPEPKDEAEADRIRTDLTRLMFEMCDTELVKLAQFGRVLASHVDSAASPVEDLIINLPAHYCHGLESGSEFAFDEIQELVDEAKEAFEEAIALAHFVIKRYPIAAGLKEAK